MERSLSADIRTNREELRLAAEEPLNVIVDLNLDCTINWASPSWVDLVGSSPNSIQGVPISHLLVGDNKFVFEETTDLMKEDDSRSRLVRFSLNLGPLSKLNVATTPQTTQPSDGHSPRIVDLEAQGILVADASSGECHVSFLAIRPLNTCCLLTSCRLCG
jgi:serine/threonine-protein kinase RIM15